MYHGGKTQQKQIMNSTTQNRESRIFFGSVTTINQSLAGVSIYMQYPKPHRRHSFFFGHGDRRLACHLELYRNLPRGCSSLNDLLMVVIVVCFCCVLFCVIGSGMKRREYVMCSRRR